MQDGRLESLTDIQLALEERSMVRLVWELALIQGENAYL
jgi:hypothetical protein